MIYGIPILHKEWIDYLWKNRRTSQFISSSCEHFANYKVKPFSNLKISLLNFPSDQFENLTQSIIENEGEVVNVDNTSCTHLVVNDSTKSNYLELLNDLNKVPEYVVDEKVNAICLVVFLFY